MANPTVFSNAYVGITTSTGGTYAEVAGVKSVEMPVSRAELADSVMGDDIEAVYPGILSVPISVTARQDFTTAATGNDKKLWALFNNKTAIKFKVRAVDTAVADDNPSFILSKCYITSVTPMSGSHGAALENRFTVKAASGGTFTRSSST